MLTDLIKTSEIVFNEINNIDLSTCELKVQLQIDLNEKLEILKNDFKNLKEFILSQYILGENFIEGIKIQSLSLAQIYI